MKYTIFTTYLLVPTGTTNDYGYSCGVHCNYINKMEIDSVFDGDANIIFNNIDDFKFLSVSGGTGYTANKIYGIIQIIDNSAYTNTSKIIPISSNWKKFDMSYQITNSVNVNHLLSPADLTSTIFKIPFNKYNIMESYNLDYLNYPSQSDNNTLCFGDEEIFFGNVSSDISAIAYSTNIDVYLPLGNFNTTTNKTWDGQSDVSISEIGIYDNEKNLVGIAKLNNPISKNETIARTIVFGLDF